MNYKSVTYLNIETEKFYPGPGNDPGCPALCPGALTTELSRTNTDPWQNYSLIVILSFPRYWQSSLYYVLWRYVFTNCGLHSDHWAFQNKHRSMTELLYYSNPLFASVPTIFAALRAMEACIHKLWLALWPLSYPVQTPIHDRITLL